MNCKVLLEQTMNSACVQNPFRKRSAKYNFLKTKTLEVFEERGWLNPPKWAVLVGFYPVRASYSYLLRLHRFGLLERSQDSGGLLVYRLSPRGFQRLLWLRGRGNPRKVGRT